MDEGVSDDERRAWFEEEESVELALPSGTRIHPAECGFELPDGRYLRIYQDGVREELSDGTAASGESHVQRALLFAHRCRVGGNTHSLGPTEYRSYRTGIDVVVLLPETLSRASDDDLIELADLILRRITEIELKIDLDDGDMVAELADGEFSAHLIDLIAVGPY